MPSHNNALTQGGHCCYKIKFYCASDILNAIPAFVFVIGALDDIYGITRRWSKYSFRFTLLLR